MNKPIIFTAPVTFGKGSDAMSMTEVYLVDAKGALGGGLYVSNEAGATIGDLAILDLVVRDGKLRVKVIAVKDTSGNQKWPIIGTVKSGT